MPDESTEQDWHKLLTEGELEQRQLELEGKSGPTGVRMLLGTRRGFGKWRIFALVFRR